MPTQATTEGGDKLYIRFGDIPSDERSIDRRNGGTEDGVSVYPCEATAIDPDAALSTYPNDPDTEYHPYGNMVQDMSSLTARDTYLVTGDEVGTGADGEPVLQKSRS